MLKTFESLGIDDRILDAIRSMDWEKQTCVLIATIPVILEGHDIIGQAQTGTGKTAAFGIPLLQMIEPKKKPSALILCPTRELAVQVAEEIRKLAKYMSDIKV